MERSQARERVPRRDSAAREWYAQEESRLVASGAGDGRAQEAGALHAANVGGGRVNRRAKSDTGSKAARKAGTTVGEREQRVSVW